MTAEQAAAKLSKAYVGSGGLHTDAIPWKDIITLIMGLLSGCSAKSAKRFAKNHPEALTFMLVNKLRDDSSLSSADIKIVAAAGVKAFNSTTATDIDGLRSEIIYDPVVT